MESCKLLTSVLTQKIRDHNGVCEVSVKFDMNSGLNRNNEIIDRVVFKVGLLPDQKDNLGKAAFREFFWKEARRVKLFMETISLVIDDLEDTPWDPQV